MGKKEKIPIEEKFYQEMRVILQTRKLIAVTILQEMDATDSEGAKYKITKQRSCRISESGKRLVISAPRVGEFWMRDGKVIFSKSPKNKNMAAKTIRTFMQRILKAHELEASN